MGIRIGIGSLKIGQGSTGVDWSSYWKPLNESLLGYWNLDEASGNAINAINPGANDGTNFQITQNQTAKINTGYQFTRANKSRVYMGSIGPLNEYSVSCWVKRESWGVGGNAFLMGFTDNLGGIMIAENGQMRLRKNAGGDLMITADQFMFSDTTSWHHFVVVISVTRGTVEFYLDRTWIGKSVVVTEALTNLVLGDTYKGGAFDAGYAFGGLIDEVALFNKELTPDEVSKLYNRTEGISWEFKNRPYQSHFYYRIPYPYYVMDYRDNKMVVFNNTTKRVKYSSDNGYSFGAELDISALTYTSDIGKIRILENGNIVFFDGKKALKYSDDNCATLKDCTVLDKNGDAFVFHTPDNANYPGAYFNFMSGFVESDGVCLLGNYCNAGTVGAAPVIVWYSLDGATWKECYQFGQNPSFTDVGDATYGEGGNLLGDATNTVLARHVHAINVGDDGAFYVCTGDNADENHIFKFVYNVGDTWTITELTDTTSDSWQRMRALGAYTHGGYLYWGSDGSAGNDNVGGVDYPTQGIFKCKVEDINDITKHTRIVDVGDTVYSFVNIDNLIISGLNGTVSEKIFISKDYGDTWVEYDKPSFGEVPAAYPVYNTLYKTFMYYQYIFMDIRGLLGV